MTDPADPKPPGPIRRPTVQSGGGSLFGGRDDRWDGGPSRIVDAPKSRWIDRIARPADRLGAPSAPAGAAAPEPTPPVQAAPSVLGQTQASPSAAAAAGRLAQLVTPLAILAFALAANSIVLGLIAFVLWVQRRKIAPNFQPPWEDPATLKDWLYRYGPKPSASPNLVESLLLRWLDRPPYQDPAALKEWVRVRLASAAIAVFGAVFIARMLLRLLAPAASSDGTSI